MTQMLDDADLRDAAARVRVAWSAVLSGDVADLREQIKQDSD